MPGDTICGSVPESRIGHWFQQRIRLKIVGIGAWAPSLTDQSREVRLRFDQAIAPLSPQRSIDTLSGLNCYEAVADTECCSDSFNRTGCFQAVYSSVV